jgi:hypothetical protein
VVTPSKMAAFYSTYALDNEIHPLVCKSKCHKDLLLANIISNISSAVKRTDIAVIPRPWL